MAKDKGAREMIYFQWHGTKCMAKASHTLPIETQVPHPLEDRPFRSGRFALFPKPPPAVTVSELLVLILLTIAILGGKQQVLAVRTMHC
jgi:hypothetical protein